MFNINKTPLFIVFAVLIAGLSLYFWQPDSPLSEPLEVVSGSSRLSELLSDQGLEGYLQAVEPRAFDFPVDHGPHPGFRNEWWYVTGNLDGAAGERFGYELTLFRIALAPSAPAATDEASAWAANQVYMGHFAVTDVDAGRFHVAERYSRGSLGLAGATAEPFRVWLEDWSIAEVVPGDTSVWRLHAADAGLLLNLTLEAQKLPVANGNNGLSQKAAATGNASYYYSITRLLTKGQLEVAGKIVEVSGLSWLDREWGSSALSAEQRGWDWFALQFDDATELMFYNLRRNDGEQDRHSAGTMTLADGTAVSLSHDDVVLEVLDYWESPYGGRYPAAWRLAVAQAGIDVTIRPVLDAQELRTVVRYWEGAVNASGERNGAPLTGRGYVELTGYAGADLPR